MRKQAAHAHAMTRAFHMVVDRARADTQRTAERFGHVEADVTHRQARRTDQELGSSRRKFAS